MPISCVGGGGGEIWVDRGDPDTYDLWEGNAEMDGDWHEWDLSGIITDEDATLVKIRGSIQDNATGNTLRFRKTGNTYQLNSLGGFTYVINTSIAFEGDITLTNLTVEYRVNVATVDQIRVVIAGWWKPV